MTKGKKLKMKLQGKKETFIDIIKDQQYRNIFEIIGILSIEGKKKVKLKHLRYALCDPHGLKLSCKEEREMKNFFQFPFKEKMYIDRMKQWEADGIVLDKEKRERWLRAIHYRATENLIERMVRQGKITPETKFTGPYPWNLLQNQITRYHKLGLIEYKQDKKEKQADYYKIAPLYIMEVKKMNIIKKINDLPEDDDLYNRLFAFIDYLQEDY